MIPEPIERARVYLLTVLGHRGAPRTPEAVAARAALNAVEVKVGMARDFPDDRDFAYCISTDPPTIVVAPKLATQVPNRIAGVLAHEFGHAALFIVGADEHAEVEADEVAYHLFGERIDYDRDDVQAIRLRYRRPRPDYLPK